MPKASQGHLPLREFKSRRGIWTQLFALLTNSIAAGNMLWTRVTRASFCAGLLLLHHYPGKPMTCIDRSCRVVLLTVILLMAALPMFATTIHVPADQPTIQDGINAAANGDTVLVESGTYFENINFNGKAITVTSADGPVVTIIDGGAVNTVVTFSTNETTASVLSGFTVQNGNNEFNGGGIMIAGASPTIKGNSIVNNLSGSGGGLSVQFGSPVIEGNFISQNRAQFGGGLYLGFCPGSRVVRNDFRGNEGSSGGGAIAFFGAGRVVVENNQFYSNISATQGGAMWIVNEADELIVQNLFVQNISTSGSEIYSLIPQSTTGFRIINNTIVSNNPNTDAAVIADGFNKNAVLINNIIAAGPGETALLCNPIYKDGPPIVQTNDAYSSSGAGYSGTCGSDLDRFGNISEDPQFVDALKSDFELLAASPAINAGKNLSGLPQKDLAGNPRIVGGTIDMGAYEYQGDR